MKKTAFSLLTIGLLGACSTMVNHQTQHVPDQTTGASNARCILENEDMKYVVVSDEKIEMMKSPHNLVVRCQAEGNRERTFFLYLEIE